MSREDLRAFARLGIPDIAKHWSPEFGHVAPASPLQTEPTDAESDATLAKFRAE